MANTSPRQLGKHERWLLKKNQTHGLFIVSLAFGWSQMHYMQSYAAVCMSVMSYRPQFYLHGLQILYTYVPRYHEYTQQLYFFKNINNLCSGAIYFSHFYVELLKYFSQLLQTLHRCNYILCICLWSLSHKHSIFGSHICFSLIHNNSNWSTWHRTWNFYTQVYICDACNIYIKRCIYSCWDLFCT